MKVVISNDHGAVELANKFKEALDKEKIEYLHLGVDNDKESVDYPDKASEAVREFRKGGYDFGILLCGTGIGISLSANKYKGIFCALPQNLYASKMAREHNDANFIAFGGRIEYKDDPVDMLLTFLNTKSSDDERHKRRREKMKNIERSE